MSEEGFKVLDGCKVSFYGSSHGSRPREIKRHVFSIIQRVPRVASRPPHLLFMRIVPSFL